MLTGFDQSTKLGDNLGPWGIEIWSPGESKWLEVSSCSNFEDFQARRGKIRYRKEEDKKDVMVASSDAIDLVETEEEGDIVTTENV